MPIYYSNGVKRKGCSCWVKHRFSHQQLEFSEKGTKEGGGGVKGVSKLICDGSMQLCMTPHTRVAIGAIVKIG
jgi:hypothetical protein